MNADSLTAEAQAGPLAGLRVLDFSTSAAGAQASQTLADFGAEVVQVEPPGGSRLRAQPGYPFLARGKQSIVLDLHAEADRALARTMASGADVVIETFRPGVMERLGLGYDDLRTANPGLVFGSVTGFGRTGPYAAAKGYEALVMARIGALSASGGMVTRPGPAHVSVPYGSYGASQLLLTGILAALHERRSSGLGQRVDTSLVKGVAALGTWNWYQQILVTKFPEAFSGGGGRQRHRRAHVADLLHAPDRAHQGRPVAAVLPGAGAPVHGHAEGHGPRLGARRRGLEGGGLRHGPPADGRVLGAAARARSGSGRWPSGSRSSKTITTCGPRPCGTAANCSTTRRCATWASRSSYSTPSAARCASRGR